MRFSSERDERRRIENFRWARECVSKCAREHVVRDYLPGQVVYNLGEYPKPFSIRPTNYDAELLELLATRGVELIQLHEGWNDSQRVLGADKFTSHDPEGLQEFVELVHSLGMKIIPYVSTGFFEATDSDFQEEWAGPGHLVELYFDYARCFPDSPGWREYLLPRMERILDQYGFDGIYDDMGYPSISADGQPLYASDLQPGEISHAAIEDLLGLVLAMCEVRDGVLKIHTGARGFTERLKLYDYLWIGEGAQHLDELREANKDLDPYVVPCPDMSRAQVADEHELYLHFIPYMQFPLRVDGRPMTGERAMVEGMNYRRGDDCFWTRHCKRIWEHYQQHPDGPHTYGWWDSVPGRAQARDIWLEYLKLYRPMVAQRSRVWVEITEGRLFATPLPEETVASLFTNQDTYLVLANFAHDPGQVKLSDEWQDRVSSARGSEWTLPPRKLLFLRKS